MCYNIYTIILQKLNTITINRYRNIFYINHSENKMFHNGLYSFWSDFHFNRMYSHTYRLRCAQRNKKFTICNMKLSESIFRSRSQHKDALPKIPSFIKKCSL